MSITTPADATAVLKHATNQSLPTPEFQPDLLIDLIEPLGSETLVHGHLTGAEEQSLVVRLAGDAPPDERLTVRPQPRHLHVFDRHSGQRIDPSRQEKPATCLAAAGTAD